MNILLLSQFFSTTRGGGEYVFSMMAKKLIENGHQVSVITNRILGEKYNFQKKIKIEFVRPTLEYKGGLPPKFSDNLSYSINTIVKGLKIIKKEKIDLIHSNNFAPALAGSILSTLTSKPHITTIHDVFSLNDDDFWKKWAQQHNVSKINAFLAPFFERFMLSLNYNCIHTVSEATKDDLLKFGVKKTIYIIPNSIEYPQNTYEKMDPLQFIYVGRLVFYKNLELVIKAIDLARKTEPNIKLVIVGSGPQKESLQKLIIKLNLEKNVEFKGYVSSEEKEKLIGNSNALVFPSLYEGFGLVILEAYAQNKPVIVLNKRPMSDIVFHDETGYVLESKEEEWAQYLLYLINNTQESERMGKNGNRLFKTEYNPDMMYEKIIKMYHFNF